jgi:hypothetical protein
LDGGTRRIPNTPHAPQVAPLAPCSIPRAEATALFRELASGRGTLGPPPDSRQRLGSSAAPEGRAGATAGGWAGPAGGGASPARQSTFSRAVAAERLAELGLDTADAAEGAEGLAGRAVPEPVEGGARVGGSRAAANSRGPGAVAPPLDRPEIAGSSGRGCIQSSTSTSSSNGGGCTQSSGCGSPGSVTPRSSDASSGEFTSTASSGGSSSDGGSSSARSNPEARAAAAGGAPAGAPHAPVGAGRACLTGEQFADALRRLAAAKFPRIANKGRAWQLLVERHVMPAVQRRRNRWGRARPCLLSRATVACGPAPRFARLVPGCTRLPAPACCSMPPQ